MRAKTIKLLEEHIGSLEEHKINPCVFELGNNFLDLTPKAPAIK